MFYRNKQTAEPIINTTSISPDQQVNMLRDIYNNIKSGHVDFFSILLLILLIYNTFKVHFLTNRVFQTKLSNILSYITKEDIEFTKKIEGNMRELLALCRADRITVGILHNGNKVGQIHQNMMSIQYEVCSVGIDDIRSRYQNVPVHKLEDELIQGLSSPNVFIKTDRNTANGNIPLKCAEYLDSLNIKRVWSYTLTTEKNEAIALFQIQWLRETDYNLESDLSRMDQISSTTNKLARLLKSELIEKIN